MAQNMTLGISGSHGFRLRNISRERLLEIVSLNLNELGQILSWNIANNIDLYRISSKMIPFASHSDMAFDWRDEFASQLISAGEQVRSTGIRVSMHPGQYTVLNSPNPQIVQNAVSEIVYHTDVLDLMGLDSSHKVIIHVGGRYSDKPSAIERFIKNFALLPDSSKQRVVIENDENNYSVHDCIHISELTGAPVIFDYLHYQLYRNSDEGLPIKQLLEEVFATWKPADGVPKTHFSTQAEGKPRGSHAMEVNEKEFFLFLKQTAGLDFDIMFETKDKEKSVLRIKKLMACHSREGGNLAK